MLKLIYYSNLYIILKIFFKLKYIIFSRSLIFTYFFFNKYFLFYNGKKFLKKHINLLCIGFSIGLFILTKKPLAKPINKLKIKL